MSLSHLSAAAVEPAGDAALPARPLPHQISSFVGREREVAEVRRLVEGCRLLTLVGAGGSGKTRLALEVAAALAERGAHAVAWVDLTPLHDPELLLSHLGASLGAREDASRGMLEVLVETLRPRALVLVLDNCEHLIDACARQVGALLQSCPELRVLATSREPLGISGERAWLVPALSLPPEGGAGPAAVTGSEAGRLFAERAQAVLASFAVTPGNAAAIAQICHRLNGLPLAIELAAARVRVLPPEQIAERLDRAFSLLTTGSRTALPRHRTLRAAIDWSYALLGEAEQVLLGRLSVFSGTFSLPAVEAVCAGEGTGAWELLDVLSGLVEKSLVELVEREGAARYRLLEVVRQYAAERLQEHGGGEALHRRHAECFLAAAGEALPHLMVASPARMDEAEAELGNFRAALAWSHASGHDDALGLPLAASLIWLWYHRILWSEGRHWLERVLHGSSGARTATRAAALQGAGTFAFFAGDLDAARAHTDEAVSIWKELGDERGLALALCGATQVCLGYGDLPGAVDCAEESVRLARRSGNGWVVAFAQGNALAPARMGQGDWAGADQALAEAEPVFRAWRYSFGLAYVLYLRAAAALRAGEPARAISTGRAALLELRARRDHWLASRVLGVMAGGAAHLGHPLEAARLHGAADSLLHAIAARLLPHEQQQRDGALAELRARVPAPDLAAALAQGEGMDFDGALDHALREADGPALAPPAEPPAPAPVAAPPGAGNEPAAPPALSVRMLGPLEIRRDGLPLPADAWSFSRPRELLLYLLVHPRGCTREQIGVLFWPDASPAQVRNSFHVTLHHLRKSLGGADWVVFEDGRYRIRTGEEVEVDAVAFERELSAALRAPRESDETARRLEDALSRYRGDFLEGESVGDWHLQLHDRLRRLYVDGLAALGDLRLERGDAAGAAAAYERLLLKEELREDVHRRLMVCRARTGGRSEAMRQYERLVSVLRDELEAEPEEESLALYERLRRAEPV